MKKGGGGVGWGGFWGECGFVLGFWMLVCLVLADIGGEIVYV